MMWFFYFADFFNNIGFWGMLISGILLLTVAIMSLIYYCDSDAFDTFSKRGFKPGKYMWSIGIVFMLFTAMPSKDTIYFMCGAHAVETFIDNSEEIQKLPDNVVKTLNLYLDKVNNVLENDANANVDATVAEN